MSYLSRLVAAVLGGLLIAALGAVPASAAGPAQQPCGCRGTVSDHVTEANAVFTGRVTKNTRLTGSTRSERSRTSTVKVRRVYKGEIVSDTVEVVSSARFGRCAVPLRKERRYVFFVEANEGYTAEDCGGTARAGRQLVKQVERLLGSGRAPVPSEEVDAGLSDEPLVGDPPPFLRLAAPGLALVLIGLLGLAVTRRVGR